MRSCWLVGILGALLIGADRPKPVPPAASGKAGKERCFLIQYKFFEVRDGQRMRPTVAPRVCVPEGTSASLVLGGNMVVARSGEKPHYEPLGHCVSVRLTKADGKRARLEASYSWRELRVNCPGRTETFERRTDVDMIVEFGHPELLTLEDGQRRNLLMLVVKPGDAD